VHLDAETVPGPVPECRAKATALEHLTRGRVHVGSGNSRPHSRDRGGLRVPDGLVKSAGVWGWRSDHDGSGQIAAVSVHYAAKVQHHQVAHGNSAVARPMMRERGMRSGRDDRVEGDAIVPRFAHRGFDHGRDAALRHTRAHRFDAPRGDRREMRRGLSYRLQLVCVLDGTRTLDDALRSAEVHSGRALLHRASQPFESRDARVLGLERRRLHAKIRQQRDERLFVARWNGPHAQPRARVR